MSRTEESAPADPPGYPHHWEADVLLRDGRTARLRPIRPDDADELVAFYERVSAESKYLRFFAPYPRLSNADVQRFTVVDYTDRVALIMTVGEAMIAVGRYDRVEADLAEVAFLVEDAHQGRGIAQLLLEHLAEAARERGITKFVAEVLPQNRKMASVFVDAGYRVHKGIEDGVLAVEFPILPTNTSVGVMERREHRAEGKSMERLLHPARVAVLGAGARAQGLVVSILSGGFRGEVVAISTDGVTVSGVPIATNLSEVEGTIDLVVAAVPTSGLSMAVIDAAHHGAHALVALTGAPASDDDAVRLVSLARAYGLRAVGPDALGLINTTTTVELNATPAPMPRVGGAGVFCQSAAVGIGLLNAASRVELGISSFVSTGEYADVTANDVMQYWEDDESTRVCVLSLESIGNPRKFSRIVRRLARRKPVIVFNPGRADRSSHAGDRGGLSRVPSEAIDSMFRQSGVIVAHRRDAMFDIAMLLGRQPLPTGPKVGLVSNSLSLRHQADQVARSVGLTLVDLPPLSANADVDEV
ncbi:MAG: GNAT family N-acetyltransferase, partial [Propionibacteriales bacterium]|nr:GNAT family N-acetyltransferase [Propionibacteriales bacterium]